MEGWKYLLLLICLNLMLNFGILAAGGHPIGDQVVSRFVNVNYVTGDTSVNSAIQQNLPANPQSGVTVLSGVAFMDGLGIIYNVIAIFLNLFTAPIGLFAIPMLNSSIAVLFIVPLVALNIILMVSFIRGLIL